MSSASKFWDQIAEKYASTPIRNPEIYERKLELTRKHLRPDMQALEFGCGTGGTAISHAPYAAQYRAMDIAPNMIKIASTKEGADQVAFEVADFDTAPILPASLDAILGLSIIHLMPDAKATTDKVYASLKPGGIFVSSTVCLGGMWYLWPLIAIGRALGKAPALKFMTVDRVRTLLTNAGFELVEDLAPEGKIKTLFVVARKP